MSGKELRRVEVLARVKSKQLKLRDAATLLEVSYRQAKRLLGRYRRDGPEGLKHANAGRTSNRAKAEKFRRKALNLVRRKYSGEEGKRFGPTLASEHLASEDGVVVDGETLRRWMLAEGLWSRVRKPRPHRKRRERKQHFGELVQMDGSFHEWLEGRGPRGCLMNLVDDATGIVLCRLGEQETIWAAVNVLAAWIGAYGVPKALYTDWKNVYKREPTEKELLHGETPVTQFGRMCERLGIRIIAASSPQAKGRVERSHGTHQDRLIKKMRRKKIGTHEQANDFLDREYLVEHNRRFAKPAAASEDYHSKAPGSAALREIFRLETERTISNDWVVRYNNRLFQLERHGRRYAPSQAKVMVCEWQDGGIEIEYRGQRLEWNEIAEMPVSPVKEEKRKLRVGKPDPAADHPWRQSYQTMRRAAGRTGGPAVFVVAASASP
jgi:transposase